MGVPMGAPVGLTVKMPVGAPVAVLAEAPVVADTLGVPGLGLAVLGLPVGATDESPDGSPVGHVVGLAVGATVGISVGHAHCGTSTGDEHWGQQ